MSYLVLGVALLVGLLLAAHWFATADPKVVLRILRWGTLALAIGLGLFFLVTGRLFWALLALPILMPWVMRARQAARMAKNFSRMRQGRAGSASGQTSDVDTRFLRMTLDHDTGAMEGEVTDGPYAGRSLDGMSLDELLDLLDACRSEDEQSVQVLEAYLDRTRAGWRDGGAAHAGGRQGRRTGGNGVMTPAEAYEVLGLESGASAKEIKEAYLRLIANVHPDHGGSTYLAAQLNQAKDVLLGS